jgi:hypothetical protein
MGDIILVPLLPNMGDIILVPLLPNMGEGVRG